MYFKILATTILFVTLSLASFADTQKAGEIIEKSLKSVGGSEKIASINAWSLSAEMNVPSQNMDLKISFWVKKPNFLKMVTDIPAMNMKMEAGTDGTTFWATQPGSDKRNPLPEAAVGQVKAQLESFKGILQSPLAEYKSKNFKLAFNGLVDIDERQCNVVNVIDEEGNSTDYYFDAISNLIYSSKSKVEAQGQEFVVEMKVKEYQKVEGLTIPKRIEISQNNELQTKLTLSSVKFNIAIDDAEFKAN
jgi:outer membrane lipoprotein-sorting protein